MRCYFRAMLAATAGLWPVAGAHASDLTVSVVNVRSNAGELLVGVYATPQAYRSGIADSATKSALLPSAGRLLGAALRARAGSQSVTFGNVPAGRYAVVVIHDENDNGLLDENVLGVPSEGYGFSNNAYGFLAAPSFEAAAVTIARTDSHVVSSITLSYPHVESKEERQEYQGLVGSSQPPP